MCVYVCGVCACVQIYYRAKHLIVGQILELLLVAHEQKATHGHHKPVPNVAKHNTEKKRKRRHRKHSGVELFIPRHPIRVHDTLCTLCDGLVTKICRGGLFCLHAVQHRLDAGATDTRTLTQCPFNLLHIRLGAPALGNEALVRHVVVEHVERDKNALLLDDILIPVFDRIFDAAQLAQLELLVANFGLAFGIV